MEITVKEAKVLKTGTSKRGEWELIKVISDDNTEYTTFDKQAKLPGGSVIEFELIIEEGKLSFKECKVISEATPSVAPVNDNMSKDDWASKQRIERASIETQVAYKGIPELVKTLAEYPNSELAKGAERWAMSKLGNGVKLKEESEQSSEVPDKGMAEHTQDTKATQAQIKKIFASSKEAGYDTETLRAIMIRKFSVGTSKDLSKSQASEFIELIEKHYGLEEKLEPEDLPLD